MNRTTIIVALAATTLLGVGGWYTRSWWWGSKPTAKASEKAEKDKSEPAEGAKSDLGKSDPVQRVASAQMNSRFVGKNSASDVNATEPLTSDEEEAALEEKPTARPTNRFAARAARDEDATDEGTAEAATDPTAGDEPTSDDPNAGAGNEMTIADTDAAAGDAEASSEENVDENAQENSEEPAKPAGPALGSNRFGSANDNPTETAEETTDEPAGEPATKPGVRDTSRAPPLRDEESATETETQETDPPSPPEDALRIEEPARAAARSLATKEPKPLPVASVDDETTTKRSLKVAKSLDQPPMLQETPPIGEDIAARAIRGAENDLGSLFQRNAIQPQEAPGDRRLEGEQSAPITLTKVAPSEVSVGRPAVFETRVRNSGSSIAHQVIVMDRIPRGARLIDATPKFSQTADGLLVWDLGSLDPGQETLIKMQLMPEEEGEIGSVATASYQVKASARAVSTRPQLEVEHSAPAKVLMGEDVTFFIRVHNPGSGVARGVRIEEDVPRGLSHDDGNQLEHEIGDLKPGETKNLELVLTAAAAGMVTNVVRVKGDGDLQAEHTAELEVLAPQLVTEISGPKRRYLDRNATYSLRVANPGTAEAKSVEFMAQLPTGLQFVSTDNSGRYDARKHAVYWKIPRLPAGQEGVVQLVLKSTATGQQALRCAARSENNLEAAHELAVLVEAAPETTFTVRDSSDPIEVGAESVYEIVVSNNGTRADTQVLITASIPPEMQIVGAEGPAAHQVDGQRVTFSPLGKLDPKSEVTYKIKVRALSAAPDPRVVKVQATSAALSTPVSREESTLIYEDR